MKITKVWELWSDLKLLSYGRIRSYDRDQILFFLHFPSLSYCLTFQIYGCSNNWL